MSLIARDLRKLRIHRKIFFSSSSSLFSFSSSCHPLSHLLPRRSHRHRFWTCINSRRPVTRSLADGIPADGNKRFRNNICCLSRQQIHGHRAVAYRRLLHRNQNVETRARTTWISTELDIESLSPSERTGLIKYFFSMLFFFFFFVPPYLTKTRICARLIVSSRYLSTSRENRRRADVGGWYSWFAVPRHGSKHAFSRKMRRIRDSPLNIPCLPTLITKKRANASRKIYFSTNWSNPTLSSRSEKLTPTIGFPRSTIGFPRHLEIGRRIFLRSIKFPSTVERKSITVLRAIFHRSRISRNRKV